MILIVLSMSAAHLVPFSRIRDSRPLPARELLRSPGQSPISWEIVVPARRRERALEGVFVGGSVAEAVAQWGAHSRTASTQPAGIREQGSDIGMSIMPGHRSHSMIFTIQALLRSRADIDRFARLLTWRMRCYQLSRPLFLIYLQLCRGLHSGIARGLNSSLGNDPLPRAAILSVVLQGHSHGGLRWVHRSTVTTHTDAMIAHAAMLVSVAMQGAQMSGSEFEIPREQMFSLLRDTTTIPDLKERLTALESLLSQDGDLESAAGLLGFTDSVTPCLVDSALLGIFAWLRYKGNFRRAVEEVARLGGDTVPAAVVAGLLAGAELGADSIPKDWLEQTVMFPYGPEWRDRFIERLRDWPHGPEDIQRTKSLPWMPVEQISRNIQFTWWWTTLPVRRVLSRLSHIKRNRG